MNASEPPKLKRVLTATQFEVEPDPQFEVYSECERLFDLADANGDGFLSREEIKQFSDTSEGQELVKLFEAESGWHSVPQDLS